MLRPITQKPEAGLKEIQLRTERARDFPEVERVHSLAFGGPAEATLVRQLRKSDAFVPELSILATRQGWIVGHVLFSKISLVSEGKNLNALSLAPVAVLPELQKRGIGKALIEEGIDRAEQLGFGAILVLGDPEYYGNFGFELRLAQKIESVYAGEYFAGLELINGTLTGIASAKAEYPAAFAQVN